MAAVEAAACSEIANGVRSPMQETALITPVMSNADRARTVKTIAGVRPNGGRGRRNIDIKIGNQYVKGQPCMLTFCLDLIIRRRRLYKSPVTHPPVKCTRAR